MKALIFVKIPNARHWLLKAAAAFALPLACVCARAQYSEFHEDRLLLETLVEKGVLSGDEAEQARKNMAAIPEVSMKDPFAKRFRLGMYAQARVQAINQDYYNETSSGSDLACGLALRRVVWFYNADFECDFHLIVAINLAEKVPFDSLQVRKTVDSGAFDGNLIFGIFKPDFTMEYTAGSRIKTPERSITNTFWGGKDMGFDDTNHERKGNQCFAGNYIGISWKGKMPFDKRFTWGASVTNAKNAHWNYIDKDIGLGYWLNAGYEVHREGLNLQSGLNFGYSTNVTSAYDPANNGAKRCSEFGFAPYIILEYGGIFLQSEIVVTSMEHGKTVSDDRAVYTTASRTSTPRGGMAMFGYGFDIAQWGRLEPIFRIAHINTDGAGVSESNVIYKIKSLNGYYNKVNAYYAGLNWYLDGNNLKVLTGFEFFQFYDSPTGAVQKNCDVSVFITQMQIMF